MQILYYKNQKGLPAAILSFADPDDDSITPSVHMTSEVEIADDGMIYATSYLRQPSEVACWYPTTREVVELVEERLRHYYPHMQEHFWTRFLDLLCGLIEHNLQGEQLREQWLAKLHAKEIWAELGKMKAEQERQEREQKKKEEERRLVEEGVDTGEGTA
jgi:hypothetical protein